MISEGPDNEIRALVSDLIASLPNKWMETRRQDIHIQLQDIFLAASPHGHSLLPFLQFLLTLSQQSVSCAQAILESGYLDIILCVSLAAFADISPTQIGDCERSQDRQVLPAIFAFFLSTLSVLAAHPVNHPSLVKRWALLRRFWASSCLQAFDEAYCNCVISQYPQPCIAVLERPFILRRLSALSTAFNRHDPEPFIRGNGCSELISLSRNCRHDSDIQAFVIAILSGFFVSPTFHRNGWRELHVQFCRSSFNVVVDILSSLMSYVLGEHTPVFAELRPARDFSELLNSLLEFADFTTQSSLTLRTAFVEAGILALQPYRDQDFWQRFQYTPSVPIGSRDKLVRVLDEEKANVLRILGQKAEQVALG
ncbi:hypothetical protein C8J56DRAFT_372248 [Mycena floridula]|nr:hypothetical protein C8J56DRAFT_372248 [Mycena floridula]